MICGCGVSEYRDEAVHFFGAKRIDGVLHTIVVLDHLTSFADYALNQRFESRAGQERPRRASRRWRNIPSDCTDLNLTEEMDRPWTGLVRLAHAFHYQGLIRAFENANPVCQLLAVPSSGEHTGHTKCRGIVPRYRFPSPRLDA